MGTVIWKVLLVWSLYGHVTLNRHVLFHSGGMEHRGSQPQTEKYVQACVCVCVCVIRMKTFVCIKKCCFMLMCI